MAFSFNASGDAGPNTFITSPVHTAPGSDHPALLWQRAVPSDSDATQGGFWLGIALAPLTVISFVWAFLAWRKWYSMIRFA